MNERVTMGQRRKAETRRGFEVMDAGAGNKSPGVAGGSGVGASAAATIASAMIVDKEVTGSGRHDQVDKGMWWMSWRREAMKDVGTCDKPKGAGNQAVILGSPNGATRWLRPSFDTECIGVECELRELKHLST